MIVANFAKRPEHCRRSMFGRAWANRVVRMDGRPASFDVVMYLGLEDGRKLPVGLSADEARQLSVALYEAALGAGGQRR